MLKLLVLELLRLVGMFATISLATIVLPLGFVFFGFRHSRVVPCGFHHW